MIDKNSFISGTEGFFIVFVLLQLSVYVCDYLQRQPRLMSKPYLKMIYEENNMTNHRGGAGNFAENPQRAAEAGSKGGKASSGNFKNNPERAVEAGRKGGSVSRRGKAQEDRV